MGVYRSHYVSPEDGDGDVRPRRGRHAAPDDDPPGYPEHDGYPESGGYSGSAGSGYASPPETPRQGGTVYGRGRQTDPWDDVRAVAGRGRDDHGGYDDYDSDGYGRSASGGTQYGRSRRDHAPHDDEFDAYQDGYPRDRRRRRDDYDDFDEFDYDDGHPEGHDDWDDEPGYNRRRRRTGDDYAERDKRKQRDPLAGLRTGVRGFGEILITFGLVVLLFAGYEVWGKSAQVDAAQNELDSKLEDTWGDEKAPKEKPLPGAAIARLHIPRLEKHWVVVEGVAPADIKNAPGHYPDSAMPGQVGNFATAGHRMPAVFWNLHKMQPGDKIFLEDETYWYEYRVTETKIVLPNAVEVVAPVPGDPNAKPTEAMLTITTCNPQWDNYERLIVHAKLAGKPKPKDEGRPLELAD